MEGEIDRPSTVIISRRPSNISCGSVPCSQKVLHVYDNTVTFFSLSYNILDIRSVDSKTCIAQSQSTSSGVDTGFVIETSGTRLRARAVGEILDLFHPHQTRPARCRNMSILGGCCWFEEFWRRDETIRCDASRQSRRPQVEKRREEQSERGGGLVAVPGWIWTGRWMHGRHGKVTPLHTKPTRRQGPVMCDVRYSEVLGTCRILTWVPAEP